MMSLKELFNKIKKENLYDFYRKIVKNSKNYQKVTRKSMYDEILKAYYDDPEIIIGLCSLEEISILRSLIENESLEADNGYIEYLLFSKLQNNYLIIEEDKYYIPDDLINSVKMALNLYDEKEHSWYDIIDSMIMGLVRIYNVIKLAELMEMLGKFNTKFDFKSLKAYINNNLKFRYILEIRKYRNVYYAVSLENLFYKEVLGMRNSLVVKDYMLEEVISIGKYRVNLFKEPIFKFLTFLERFLKKEYIDELLNDLIIYAGLDINDDIVLRNIAGNIDKLYDEIVLVIPYFPVWLSHENNVDNKN